MRRISRISPILTVAVVALTACTSNPPPLSKSKATEKLTAASDAFTSGIQRVLDQDQLPNATGHAEYRRPTAAEDAAIANLIEQLRSKLISVDWPSPASDKVGAVESALSDEASDTRAVEGVPGTSAALGRDYANLTNAERIELRAENQLRSALGLPKGR
jgi:hypothetical protein